MTMDEVIVELAAGMKGLADAVFVLDARLTALEAKYPITPQPQPPLGDSHEKQSQPIEGGKE